jgi:hypothetical protein
MTRYASNAIRPIIGNTYVIDSLEARGKIRPIPPITGETNGLGELVWAGLWSYEWTFTTFNLDEMNWIQGLLGHIPGTGLPLSKRFTTGAGLPAFRLWDTLLSLIDFRAGVLQVPTWEDYRNATFREVTLRITHLEITP